MDGYLSFPKKLFRKTFGLGIDSGASCFKIAYTTEHDDNLQFHFVTFANTNYLEALDFIKRTCGDKLTPGEEIVTCGVSANEKHQVMTDVLGIRAQNKNEFTCAVNVLRFFAKNLPFDEWAQKGSKHAIADGLKRNRDMTRLWDQFADGQYKSRENPADALDEGEAPPDTLCYPLFMGNMGSIPHVHLVQEDGSLFTENWIQLGGRSLLGISNYICGRQLTFEELITMAREGDSTKVHQLMSLFGGDPSDSIYGSMADKDSLLRAFDFGHLVNGAADVDQKDFISALLTTIIQSAVRMSVMMSAIHKVSQVFYVGSLACYNDMIQDMITADYVYESRRLGVEHKSHHYFVKYGSHLPAIGALLANLELAE